MNEDFTIFGSFPGNAIVAFSSPEGVQAFMRMVMTEHIRRLGLEHVVRQEEVEQFVAEKFREMKAHWTAEGVPEGLARLLAATRKKEVEKVAKGLMVTGRQMAMLVLNHAQLGYTHRQKFPRHTPPHLAFTDTERDAVARSRPGPLEGPAKTFVNKLFSTFEERRHIYVHMFEKAPEWHCFWFADQDATASATRGTNHWDGGPHLHYVSHLWPGRDREEVWRVFDQRQTNIPGSLHIRFHARQMDSDASARDL
jgi:hypothetical protein